MDIQGTATVVAMLATGAGSYIGGRVQGRGAASQVAADTVDMLQTQVDLLKGDKEEKDLLILDLRNRVEVLESLVTQRAEVEELNTRVSLVKDTVERIAVKVGA